jgi:hypothetical protein
LRLILSVLAKSPGVGLCHLPLGLLLRNRHRYHIDGSCLTMAREEDAKHGSGSEENDGTLGRQWTKVSIRSTPSLKRSVPRAGWVRWRDYAHRATLVSRLAALDAGQVEGW